MYWYFPYLSLIITVRLLVQRISIFAVLQFYFEEHRYKSRSENREFSGSEMIVKAHSISNHIGWVSISLPDQGSSRCPRTVRRGPPFIPFLRPSSYT